MKEPQERNQLTFLTPLNGLTNRPIEELFVNELKQVKLVAFFLVALSNARKVEAFSCILVPVTSPLI